MYTLFLKNRQYGIRGERIRVADVACRRESLETLLAQLNALELSECHLYDVIEDWFGW